MKINLRRRQFVLASTATAFVPFGLTRTAAAQSQLATLGSVPTVDSLKISVLIEDAGKRLPCSHCRATLPGN